MTTAVRPSILMLALVPLAALTGCAITSAAPGGPLHAGTTTQFQASWALAYGRGSATVGGTRLTGNAESYGGTTAELLPVPMRVGMRQSLGSAVDASADVGWLDSGVELPWIVLAHSAPTKMVCSSCPIDHATSSNLPVTDYSQSWGVSLVLTPSGWRDFIGLLLGD